MENQIETIVTEEGMSMRKKIIIGILIIIAACLLGGIVYYNNYRLNSELPDVETAVCVSKALSLYTSTGCSHCATQKKLLDKYVRIFNETDCVNNPKVCMDLGITGVPSWQKGTEIRSGVQRWPELIKWAECENASVYN